MLGAGIKEDTYLNDMFFEEWHLLPRGYTIQYIEVARFFRKKPFEYYFEDQKESIKCENTPDMWQAFRYYNNLFCDYLEFGLPHGCGYLAEPAWYLDFIKLFSALKNETENFRSKMNNGRY